MMSLSKNVLKNLLVEEGVLNENLFEEMYIEARRKQQKIVDVLVSRGVITEEYFFTILSKHLNVERVHLNTANINGDVLRLLPQNIARERRVVVFGKRPDGSYSVGMEDPTNLETINFLTLFLKAPIVPYLATDGDLQRGFVLYEEERTHNFEDTISASVAKSLEAKAKGTLKEAAEDLPVVELVSTLFSYAVSLNSSDIHFEALEDVVLVRFRVDGILREIVRIPKDIHPALIARLKVLSGLRVDEHSRPQDGRFRHMIGSDRVDVRVSVIPTFYGEKAVLRLLASAQKPISLSDLGMLDDHIELIKLAITRSYGMILVCGPTGVGKTTTLYSIINMLNRPEVNIVTVEDPVEYDMRYVNQVQVNVASGITFASGLRSILRQDPNIIMVGEIRDNDTANISVQAALTGHLLLSSLHTNDSPTAVPRLVDMGIPSFLVSAVIALVSSQRLVRRIHTGCVESYAPSEEMTENIASYLKTLGSPIEGVSVPKEFYKGKGCEACGGSGYAGQLGLFEVLPVSDKVRKDIVSPNFSLGAVRDSARAEGVISMFEDGLRKVELGMTTIEEVFRVVRE